MVDTSDQKRFQLKKWNAVALWAWDIEVENCAICKGQIYEPCIQCQSDQRDDDQCTVAWGHCNHAFHFHCIQKWVKSTPRCPLCNKEWDWAKYGNGGK